MKSLFKHVCMMFGIAILAMASKTEAQVISPPPGAVEWGVEGPITAIDPVAGTITANGVKVTIPATVPLQGSRGLNGATLAQLLDAAAPNRVRSIFASTVENPGYTAGTLRANGFILDTATGRVYQAVNVFVDLAENILVGPLDSVDVANRTFVVNGATCRVNADERFPADIVDAGGVAITFADLATAVGTIVTVTGYSHGGRMYSTLLETDIVPATPNTDTVRITRAQGRAKPNNRSELLVNGVVSPFDANATMTILDVETGAVLGTVAVIPGGLPGQGEFRFQRKDLPGVPARVRARSSNGGTHEFDVDIR